jgi:hypothetical protein
MNIYLVTQILIVEREVVGLTINSKYQVVVRRVSAESLEEALGIFLLQTTRIEAVEKLLPNGNLLEEVQLFTK